MPRLFDRVVIVDWSARSTPSPTRPSADAIWIAEDGVGGPTPPRYWRTRAAAMAWLTDLLEEARGAGHRVLVGFDFPFGYPRGFAEAVTGDASGLAVWARLAGMIADGRDNANNRFAVAESLNACFDGIGPFWGRPATLPCPGVPTRGRARHGCHPPERRLTEARLRRAQPCWKLFTTGSVGSQALLGLPALHRLRTATGAAVWPFDTGLATPQAPLVLAEVYPSLLARAVSAAQAADEVLDAAQVRVLASALARLDAAGGLAALFGPASGLSPADQAVVAREEAWILGLGGEAALEAAC